jgi:hypothetical protein
VFRDPTNQHPLLPRSPASHVAQPRPPPPRLGLVANRPPPSSTRHPQAAPNGSRGRTCFKRGRAPAVAPFSSSHHFFPNRTPHEAPPLPLFLLSTLVPKAATIPPVLEPPRQPFPFSRELLPLEPPITNWLVPLSPLHSLRLLEHLVIVADHHGSPERRRPEALLRLTDDKAPQ